MSDERYPEELRYHPAHDWVRVHEDGTAELGVTWQAQHLLGDVVHFEPPTTGESFDAGQAYGELESVKTVSDVIAPAGGEVLEVNDDIVQTPEKVNEDPYAAWLVRIKIADAGELDALLTAEQYRRMVDDAEGVAGDT